MKTILEWVGPLSMRELLTSPDKRDQFSRSGVYIWEEQTDNAYCVSYVGKGNNLWKRQLEHYWYQLGSAYLLPGRYRDCGEDWSLDMSSLHVQETLFDLPKFTKLVSENFAYINSLRIHLAFTDDTKVVEANLIYALQPVGNSRGKVTPPATVIEFEHRNRKWTANNTPEDIRR